jgi:hypothetical protein
LAYWNKPRALGVVLDTYGKTHVFYKPALQTAETNLQTGTLVVVDLEGQYSRPKICRVNLAEAVDEHPDVPILKAKLDARLWQSEQQRLDKITVGDKEEYYGFTQTRIKNKFRRKEEHGN